jgi:hydroxyacylglutathione hydrolase
MPMEITRINLSMPFGLGAVNVYLLKTGTGFILIDTGTSNQRTKLERRLEEAGCKPGDLRLILLTHGDFDHTGNAAYLKFKFGARIAIGGDDSGMLERGDMFWNRKKGNALLRKMVPLLIGFGKKSMVKPDVNLDEKFDLSHFDFHANVLSIPGHSKGSMGILTKEGDLFCGDLLENIQLVGLNSIMDDLVEAKASIEKLKRLKIKTVFPGHGEPFPFDRVLEMQL